MKRQKSERVAKKALNRLFYICAMVVFTLFVCESVVRVYSWFFFQKMMKIDPSLGWYHVSNTKKYYTTEGETALITQNELGHRGPNYGPQKADGKKRVLVLGDSFTEGSQVGDDDLFTAIIANADSNLEVMNAGIGGYNSVQEYLYLQKTGKELRPDLVLVMFYENDLAENCLSFYPSIGPRPFASIENGQLMIHENPSPKEHLKYVLPLPFAEKLNKHSLAYHFFNFRVYQPLRASYLTQLEFDDLKKTETYPKLDIIGMVYQKIQKLMKGRGAMFAVGLIPTREEAQNGFSDIQAPLLSFCREKDIPCFSLVQSFKEAYDKGKKPYFEVDIHWSKEGHRVASEALGPFIQGILSSHQN